MIIRFLFSIGSVLTKIHIYTKNVTWNTKNLNLICIIFENFSLEKLHIKKMCFFDPLNIFLNVKSQMISLVLKISRFFPRKYSKKLHTSTIYGV